MTGAGNFSDKGAKMNEQKENAKETEPKKEEPKKEEKLPFVLHFTHIPFFPSI